MSSNMSLLFDSMPRDIQDKVCEKILYPQPTALLEEIRSTRLNKFFRDTLSVFGVKSKKIGFSLYETQTILRKRKMYDLAEKMGQICEEIYLKMDNE